ncbi:hypothetical protein [Kluyvera intermedia]|uniref:hypothetical protein n=1 Tax=Kluyvera intermedia TaxID=61648 RepID=UPI0035257707
MNTIKTPSAYLTELLDSLFSDDYLNPPFDLKKDIVTDFNERCDKFIELIESHEYDNKTGLRIDLLLNRVNELKLGIDKCLKKFLSGDIKSAYEIFESMLEPDRINKHILHVTVPLKSICNDDQQLYRVRKSDSPLLTKNEIFHIPFSNRHLVSAQRYSVAGLPCLYLGTSLYVCWQEMNKPDFDKLYISAFTTEDVNSRILNFAPSLLNEVYEGDESSKNLTQRKASYLTLWPLIIACSFIRKHNDSKFIQEYIIPNLLMQWVSQRKQSPIVGISYFSTRMKKSKNSRKSINVVFPPKANYNQTADNEFSPQLSSLFYFTPPVSWQVLKTLDYNIVIENTEEQIAAVEHLKFRENSFGITDFDEDLVKLYPLTDFYKLEESLKLLFEYGKIKGIIQR